MRRSRWLEAALVALGSLAFAAIGCREVLRRFGEIGAANDWDQHLLWYWTARESVVRFGQFPLWDPWACGGTPLFAGSQSHVWTPAFAIQLALGVARGVHVEIVLHLALLAAGGYVLGRILRLERAAAAAVGLLFGGSSWYAAHLAEGHGWTMTYAYTPWAAAALLYAIRERRLVFAAIAGALLANMIGAGGIYPAPHAALLLALLAVFESKRRDLIAVTAIAIAGVTAVLLAAPKLLPVLELMKQDPRLTSAHESMAPRVLFAALFGLDQDRFRALPRDHWYWGFHEYEAYVGPAFALLAIAGALFAGRRAWRWIALAALFFSLGLGDYLEDFSKAHGDVPVTPWALLHSLPLFHSQRVPFRFLIMFVLAAAVLAGFGIDELSRRFGSRGRAAALASLCIAVAMQAWVGPPNLRHMFEGSEPEVPPSAAFRQIWTQSDRVMFALARSNQGALHCYEYTALKPRALAANGRGYRGEVWLEGDGSAQLTRWSPNELALAVDARSPSRVVVNQNFDENWTLASGMGRVVEHRGTLAVELPSGAHALVLRYVSARFRVGLLLFALGVALCAALIALDRRAARTRP